MPESHLTPKPSAQVARALTIEGTVPACDGLVAISAHQVQRRPTEDYSRFLHILAGERRVEIYLSPTGRSVRVYVDGTEA